MCLGRQYAHTHTVRESESEVYHSIYHSPAFISTSWWISLLITLGLHTVLCSNASSHIRDLPSTSLCIQSIAFLIKCCHTQLINVNSPNVLCLAGTARPESVARPCRQCAGACTRCLSLLGCRVCPPPRHVSLSCCLCQQVVPLCRLPFKATV